MALLSPRSSRAARRGSHSSVSSAAAADLPDAPVTASLLREMLGDLRASLQEDMRSMMAELRREVEELGSCTDHLENKMSELVSSHNELWEAHDNLQLLATRTHAKTLDLEDRSRRNNVKLRGIAETVGTEDLKAFLQDFILTVLPLYTKEGIIIDRIHRIPKPSGLDPSVPRDVLARIHFFVMKDEFLQALRANPSLPDRFAAVTVFPDLSPIFFYGYFKLNDTSEVMECNLEVSGKHVCTYKDPATGNIWQCVRPRKLPCDSWVYHSMGGFHKVTNQLEDSILSGSVTDKIIPGSVSLINVTTGNSSVGLTSNLPVCQRGQDSPQPSGFYYADRWTSLSCLNHRFPQPTDALTCLKGKDIYMMGDSTLRQWFEYLESTIPSLKKIDLHVHYLSGPLLAVDADAGLVIRYRSHGLPLKTSKTLVSNLQYESAQLAGIDGGPNTVVVMTFCPHFASFPLRVYLERLEKVQKAVASLLFRSPETTVIIKSANTGFEKLCISDWLSLQLDIIMRAVFKGMGVIILDVWDMTSCHYLPINIHPGPPVIKNEVDLMLSHICPK
ncbi:NXPE family member 3-like [Ranitomeya variabilis]|uniref:NXPE family member 3-like n=1 Tax=Ranitomeya variabilis TaxID=490064 RepID=UPI0040575E43